MPHTHHQHHALHPLAVVFLVLAVAFILLDALLTFPRSIDMTASLVLATGAVVSLLAAWLHWRWDA